MQNVHLFSARCRYYIIFIRARSIPTQTHTHVLAKGFVIRFALVTACFFFVLVFVWWHVVNYSAATLSRVIWTFGTYSIFRLTRQHVQHVARVNIYLFVQVACGCCRGKVQWCLIKRRWHQTKDDHRHTHALRVWSLRVCVSKLSSRCICFRYARHMVQLYSN